MAVRKKKLHAATLKTPVGTVEILSTDKGVAGLTITEDKQAFHASVARQFPDHEIVEDKGANAQAIKAVRTMLSGLDPASSVPLDLKGSPFQLKVWRQLLRIPYGKTLTYGQVAAKINKKGASRAVGGACRANPVGIIVPCHRVIGADGTMTGYGGKSGVGLKQKLLKIEGWKRG